MRQRGTNARVMLRSIGWKSLTLTSAAVIVGLVGLGLAGVSSAVLGGIAGTCVIAIALSVGLRASNVATRSRDVRPIGFAEGAPTAIAFSIVILAVLYGLAALIR
jgi:hypothetical protein